MRFPSSLGRFAEADNRMLTVLSPPRPPVKRVPSFRCGFEDCVTCGVWEGWTLHERPKGQSRPWPGAVQSTAQEKQ